MEIMFVANHFFATLTRGADTQPLTLDRVLMKKPTSLTPRNPGHSFATSHDLRGSLESTRPYYTALQQGCKIHLKYF
jgi:hypothetical protein